MTVVLIALLIVGLVTASYLAGRRRVLAETGGDPRELRSLPGFYGSYAAIWCALPGLAVLGSLAGHLCATRRAADPGRGP